MIVFPNCKINLGLHIKDRRPDGFHNLETIFIPVLLQDALEVVNSPESTTSLSVTGIEIDAQAEDNICIKAYRLLQHQFPELPAIKVHLHKTIPSGAGLGGGSADGAFMLRLLNKKYKLGLGDDQLISLALQLGSDCPFFILNQPCFATGRGEQMTPIQVNLSGYEILLVNPRIHVNTGWAFKQLEPGRTHQDLLQVIAQPVPVWKGLLGNDFEVPVFAAHPEIKAIKDQLYDAGADYAAMSGSGSTVFGLFRTGNTPALPLPDHYFTWTGKAGMAS